MTTLESILESIDVKNDPRVMDLFGVLYIRSDLAADILQMHRNTLLNKAKEGKIRRFRKSRAVWFKIEWLKEYIYKESA